MATFQEVADVLQVSMLQMIVKYAGGRVSAVGAKKIKGSGSKGVTDDETILHEHFTSGNDKIYEPLSPKYAKWKKAKIGEQPILVFAGKMRDSLVGKTKIFAKKNGQFILRFPNQIKYAKYHAEVSGKRPIRNPTAITKEDKKRNETNLKLIIKSNYNALTKGVTQTKHQKS